MASERSGRTNGMAMRVSEAEREQTVVALREQCVASRLTLDELSSRIRAAYEAKTHEDLVAVTNDLPVAAAHSAPAASSPHMTMLGQPEARPMSRWAAAQRQATRWTVALLGSESRKGRWRIDEQTNTVAVMGSCTLDLRDVALEAPEIRITAFSVMGSVDIIVPEGVEVELGGLAIMGSRDCRVNMAAVHPGAPFVRVQAFALMGSISVKSKPRL